jgi:hypothetical protein
MLVDISSAVPWAYMEVPRTASTSLDRYLRALYPKAHAPFQKHWPICPPRDHENRSVYRFISLRNPYSRAVSCWQFFTKPNSISFLDWLKKVDTFGFIDGDIEARPQFFWWRLDSWDKVIYKENIEKDVLSLLEALQATAQQKATPFPKMNEIGGPWFNKTGRPTKGLRDKPWHAFYCKNTEELVQKIYRDDFTHLGFLLDFYEAVRADPN